MTDNTEALPPLLPCPMCGEAKGYTLSEGSTYRWWDVSCAECGRDIGECASDRRTHLGGILPDRWEDADEAWNDAAAHAESLRVALSQRQQVPGTPKAWITREPDGNESDGSYGGMREGVVLGADRPDFGVEPLFALAAAPSAQAEPVAWRDPTNKNPGQSVTFDPAIRNRWPHIYSEPLYAAPPAAQTEPQEPLPESDTCELRAAAKAVIDRWHTPAWKDVPHTAEFIYRLERALGISKKEGSA